MKLLTLFISFGLLVGCGSNISEQKKEVITLKILKVVKEDTKWGCIGTDYYTLVEVKELGFRDKMCGDLGNAGDEFKGCFVSNSVDPVNNGLRRYCD